MQIRSEAETAQMTGLSVRTLQRYRAEGIVNLPYVRLGLRRVGYSDSDIAAFLASRTFQSRAAELAKTAA